MRLLLLLLLLLIREQLNYLLCRLRNYSKRNLPDGSFFLMPVEYGFGDTCTYLCHVLTNEVQYEEENIRTLQLLGNVRVSPKGSQVISNLEMIQIFIDTVEREEDGHR